MRQLISNTEAETTTYSSSTDLYDPWRTHSGSSTAANTLQNEHEDVLESHVEIAQQQHPRNWRWLCCTCCSNQQVTYRRAIQRISNVEPLTSLTPEEESAFLLDCDELGLTWGNNEENNR